MSIYSALPEITVSTTDFNRLSSLLDHINLANPVAEGLFEELDRANIVAVADLPQNIVCMNSVIRFRNELDNKVYQKSLVYPHELAECADNISILTPAGTALLGLRTGDSIEWPISDNRKMKIRILKVIPPQPESNIFEGIVEVLS